MISRVCALSLEIPAVLLEGDSSWDLRRKGILIFLRRRCLINFLQRHVDYRDNKYSHFQLDFGIPERTDVKKDILCSDLCAKHIFFGRKYFL